ncbi:hypothetical protein ACHAWF_002698 [Thalassiosira exigua]
MIINLCAFRHTHRSHAFINTAIPVLDLPLTLTLADLVAQEVMRLNDSIMFSGDIIVQVKSGEGLDGTPVLALPVAMFFQQIQNEMPKELCVVLRSGEQQAAVPTAPTAMDRLMAASKPTVK